MSVAHPTSSPTTLADLVVQSTGTCVLNCYQCGRCAAGCPQNVPGFMDISPTRIMHLLQLEDTFSNDPPRAAEYARQALTSSTCWLCAGCQACTTRCPQGVDIAGVMDVLRQQASALGLAAADRRSEDIQKFHATFLAAALKHGRIPELDLVLRYKLASGHWLEDATVGWQMLRRGKLSLSRSATVDTSKIQAALRQMGAGPDGGIEEAKT